MLTDFQTQIRELAAHRILKARSTRTNKIRLFQAYCSSLYFNALSYVDFIVWQKNNGEPPILNLYVFISIYIQLLVERRGEDNISLLRLSCHTQAVKRAVKTLTEASRTLCSKSEKKGFIKAQIESRKIISTFDSKKDFITI